MGSQRISAAALVTATFYGACSADEEPGSAPDHHT
jgi:hypothetical protein